MSQIRVDHANWNDAILGLGACCVSWIFLLAAGEPGVGVAVRWRCGERFPGRAAEPGCLLIEVPVCMKAAGVSGGVTPGCFLWDMGSRAALQEWFINFW